MRPSHEIEAELEALRLSLLALCQGKEAFQYIDLKHIALRFEDLKRELRLARVNEQG